MPVFSKFSCGALAILTLTTSAHASRTIVYTKGVTLINDSSISVNLNCNNYTFIHDHPSANKNKTPRPRRSKQPPSSEPSSIHQDPKTSPMLQQPAPLSLPNAGTEQILHLLDPLNHSVRDLIHADESRQADPTTALHEKNRHELFRKTLSHIKALVDDKPSLKWILKDKLSSPFLQALKNLSSGLNVAALSNDESILFNTEDAYTVLFCCRTWESQLSGETASNRSMDPKSLIESIQRNASIPQVPDQNPTDKDQPLDNDN